MKKVILFFVSILFFATADTNAQLRGDVSSPFDYQGTVINSQSATVQSKLANFFQNNVTMSHSYTMSFGSVGGSYQNLNAYTNSLDIRFSDRLNGRVDVSFFHSPFGGTNLYGMNQNQPQVLLSNAELNYKINDNAFISFQYRRMPSNAFGFSPYGYGFDNFHRNRSWYR